MATLNLKERATKGGTGEAWVVLPTDIYRMKVVEAAIEENTLAKPNRDGSQPLNVVITWEIVALSEEQQEAADEAEEDWSDVRVWQRLNPYYGLVKDGGPSKFKQFIDGLRAQGILDGFDEEAFDPEIFLDLEQRVSIERYIKTMGKNAGQPGNKVTSISPIRVPKAKKAAASDGPTPEQRQRAAVVAKGETISEDDLAF